MVLCASITGCGAQAPTPVPRSSASEGAATAPPLPAATEQGAGGAATVGPVQGDGWQEIREAAWGYEIAVPDTWLVVTSSLDEQARAKLIDEYPEDLTAGIDYALLDLQGNENLRWVALVPDPFDSRVSWELRPGILGAGVTFDDWVRQQRSEVDAAMGGVFPVTVQEFHVATSAKRIEGYRGLLHVIFLPRGEDVWVLNLGLTDRPHDDATVRAILDRYRPIVG
jgi:hypothetical protein